MEGEECGGGGEEEEDTKQGLLTFPVSLALTKVAEQERETVKNANGGYVSFRVS